MKKNFLLTTILKSIFSKNKANQSKDTSNLRQYLLQGSLGSFILKIFSVILGFSTSIILARILNASGYGIYANAIAWLGLLSIFATMGFPNLLIREISIYHTKLKWTKIKGILKFCNRVTFSITIFLMVGTAILGKILYTSNDKSSMLTSLWLALLILPLSALVKIKQSAIQGFRHIILGQLPEIFIRPLTFILLVCFFYLFYKVNFSPEISVILHLFATILAFIISIYWLRRLTAKKIKLLKANYESNKWIKSALPLAFISAITIINTKLGIIMLGAMSGSEAAGIFAIINRGAYLITFPLLAISRPLSPIIAHYYANSELHKLQKILTKSTRTVFFFSLPIAILFIIFGNQFLLIFGEEFTQGRLAFSILVLGALINVSSGLVGLLLNMTKNEGDTALIVGISVLIHIILNIILIPILDIEGAAIGLTVSTIFWNLILVYFVSKRLNISSTIFGKLLLFKK